MSRVIMRGAFVGSILLLLLGVPAAARDSSRLTVIHTQWELEALAMSGPRVAYDVSATFMSPARAGCTNKILVRNLRTGTTRRVSGPKTCYADGTPTGDGVRELAVAGRRLAWIINQGGNTQSYDYLRAASLPRPKERKLASAARYGDLGNLVGNWIGRLLGAGDALAVNRWATEANGAVTRSGLDVIGMHGLRRIVAGPSGIFAQSMDRTRIAVLRADGGIGVYAMSGRLLLKLEPSSAAEVALDGANLLVLTKTGMLEIYDSHSGAHLRSWTVARGATNLDAYGNVAVYAVQPKYTGGRLQVHALRLRTGKDAVVGSGTFRGRPRRDVHVEAPGLVYAKDAHTLVLVPLRRLLAALS